MILTNYPAGNMALNHAFHEDMPTFEEQRTQCHSLYSEWYQLRGQSVYYKMELASIAYRLTNRYKDSEKKAGNKISVHAAYEHVMGPGRISHFKWGTVNKYSKYWAKHDIVKNYWLNHEIDSKDIQKCTEKEWRWAIYGEPTESSDSSSSPNEELKAEIKILEAANKTLSDQETDWIKTVENLEAEVQKLKTEVAQYVVATQDENLDEKMDLFANELSGL